MGFDKLIEAVVAGIVSAILAGASVVGACLTPQGDLEVPTPAGTVSIEAQVVARAGVINAPTC